MNSTIDRLLDKAKLTPVQEIFEPELYEFSKLLVKETINEMIGQLWNYGIDESNNPSFYKAVERTKQHFGVE